MSRDQGCWTAQRQVGPGERTWAVWHIRNLDIKGSLKKKDANVVDEDEVAQFGCSPQSVGRSRRSIESGSATYWKRWKWISLPTRLEKNAELNWNEMKRERKRERVGGREWKRGRERDLSAGKSSPSSSFCFWFWPQTKLAITLDDQRCWFWAARCTFSYFYGVPRNYR